MLRELKSHATDSTIDLRCESSSTTIMEAVQTTFKHAVDAAAKGVSDLALKVQDATGISQAAETRANTTGSAQAAVQDRKMSATGELWRWCCVHPTQGCKRLRFWRA